MGQDQYGDDPARRRAKWQRRAAWLRKLQILCPLAGLGILAAALVFGKAVGLGGIAVASVLSLGFTWGSDAFARMAVRADAEGTRSTPAELAQEDADVDAAIAAMEREQAAEAAAQTKGTGRGVDAATWTGSVYIVEGSDAASQSLH